MVFYKIHYMATPDPQRVYRRTPLPLNSQAARDAQSVIEICALASGQAVRLFKLPGQKTIIQFIRRLTTCPQEIERCAVSIPTGKMHRPSGAPLDIPMIVDYPIDTRDPDALADTVAAWRAEIAGPPVN